MESSKEVDYDLVLSYVGQFGRFQKIILFFLSLVSSAGGLAVVVFAFTGFEPSYRCRVSECESGPTISYYADNRDLVLPPWYKGNKVERENRCRNLLVTKEMAEEGFCTAQNSSFTWVQLGEERRLYHVRVQF